MILDDFNLNYKQLEKLKKYYLYLVEKNTTINLTSIIEETEVYIKHFYDSLYLSKIVNFSSFDNFLDVGSGAGFPAIPLKIMYPDLKVTIIEPTLKRVKFLSEVISLLGLKDVTLINGRAEDIKPSQRESFSLASARAVSSLPVLLELIIPYLSVGGIFLAPKGPSYEGEVDLAGTALLELGSKVEEVRKYELPNDYGKRVVIKIVKKKITKKIYPRQYSQIKKKHL